MNDLKLFKKEDNSDSDKTEMVNEDWPSDTRC